MAFLIRWLPLALIVTAILFIGLGIVSDPLWPAQDATPEMMEFHRNAERFANTCYLVGLFTFVVGIGAFLGRLLFSRARPETSRNTKA